MELKHATDLEIKKHAASHLPPETAKRREQETTRNLLSKRNAAMLRAHVLPVQQKLQVFHKEDDESHAREVGERRAETPGEKHRRRFRVQAAITRAKHLREGKRMKTFSELKEATTPASAALVNAMNSALADTFAFYLKAHNYHWNIEGADFAQYHDFLGKLYEDAHGAVDDIAERIRTLNAFAKGTMENFLNEASITEDSTVPGPMQMLQNIAADNDTLINTITTAFKAAEADGKVGLANFLQDRIDIHEKHGWMLRSLVKGNLSEELEMSNNLNEETRLPPKFYAKVVAKLNKKKAGMKEDVQQIDELSKDTLSKYVKSAEADATNKNREATKNRLVGKRSPRHAAAQAIADKLDRARNKRLDKIDLARAKMAKEEVEQIAEVGDTPKGKATLASYVKKAAPQIRSNTTLKRDFEDEKYRHLKTALKHSPNVDPHKTHERDPEKRANAEYLSKGASDLSDKFGLRAKNRIKGIQRAAARLAKEEVEETDEAVRIYDRIRSKIDPQHGEKGTFQGDMERLHMAAAARDRRKITKGYGVKGFNSAMLKPKTGSLDTDLVRAKKTNEEVEQIYEAANYTLKHVGTSHPKDVTDDEDQPVKATEKSYEIHKDGKKVGELEHHYNEYGGHFYSGNLHGRKFPWARNNNSLGGKNDAHSYLASALKSKWHTSKHSATNEEVEQVSEVLKPSMGASAYISDFVHSKNPKFAGKSKAERTKMALGAYYGAKKAMKEGLDPVGKEDSDVNNDGKHGHSTDKYLLKRRAAISKSIAAKKGK